jgi:Polyketide cyclase / dehydrase and lipid transport
MGDAARERDSSAAEGSLGPRRSGRRHVVSAIGVGFALTLLSSVPWAVDARGGPRWQRDRRDPRWVQGQVDLAASPDVVWQRVADVRAWPSLFSDIESLSVESMSSDRTRWVVRFQSKTLGHGPQYYFVSLDPEKRAGRMVIHAPAVRAAAFASIAPLGDVRSRATYAAFAERHGLFGWFLSEQDLRVRQERLMERTLDDLQSAFGASAHR